MRGAKAPPIGSAQASSVILGVVYGKSIVGDSTTPTSAKLWRRGLFSGSDSVSERLSDPQDSD
jgi:hypothetical protein